MIKAAFFDVDGTLLSHKTKQVPYSTKAALRSLKDAGIRCIVSTGRMLQEMERLPMGELTFDAYITMNGQLTLDREKTPLYGMSLEGEAKDYALKIFQERKIPVILVEQDRLYLNYDCQRVADVQTSISSKVPPLGNYEGAEIYQACIYVTVGEEWVLQPILGSCEVTRWHPGGVDVIAKGGGKRTAVERYLKANNILPEETIAFGDGENDIGMLELAGIGVAMGNAEEAVKKAADYVTADIDDDGVEKALIHFGLINKGVLKKVLY